MGGRRAFLLAGGASRRFGRDKALHPIDGQPMALRVAEVMQRALGPVTLVAPDRRLASLGLPILVEPSEGTRHPLRGVVAALLCCEADGVELAVFCPCDLPWLEAASFVALSAAPGPRVARAGGRLHPLLVQAPVGWLPRAQRLLVEGGAARSFVEGAHPVDLPADQLRNINRVSDLGPAVG